MSLNSWIQTEFERNLLLPSINFWKLDKFQLVGLHLSKARLRLWKFLDNVANKFKMVV